MQEKSPRYYLINHLPQTITEIGSYQQTENSLYLVKELAPGRRQYTIKTNDALELETITNDQTLTIMALKYSTYKWLKPNPSL